MSPTGYEVQMYRDISRAADALEKIALSLDRFVSDKLAWEVVDKLVSDKLATIDKLVSDKLEDGLRNRGQELQDAFVDALRDRGANRVATRLAMLDADEAWASWFGPLADRIEEQL